jgi:iron(III) transport system ATP-binding protein
MQKQLAITTIFVTHDQEEAMTTADRIAVMHQGVIQQVGAPTALYDDPVNRFVAEFVGTINLVPGEASAGTVASPLGAVGLPAGSGGRTGRVEIAFRPHSVALSAAPGNASRHWVAATVSEREFLGEFVRYRVRAGDVELIADQPHALGDPGFAPGARVHVGVDPGQLRLIPA